MPADYSAYKPTLNDTQYATKINSFITAVQIDMNEKANLTDITAKTYRSVTYDYTPVDADYTISIDATVANVSITLPPAASNEGRFLVFRKADSCYSGIIGALYTLYDAGETVTIQSTGTAWVVVAH